MKPVLILMAVFCGFVIGCQRDGGTDASLQLDRNVQDEAWVAIEPTQCLTNSWEMDWLANNNGDYSGYPKDPTRPGLEHEEFEIIQDYYSRQGVVVFEATTRPKYETVCLACSCPEGHTMYLAVRNQDVDIMVGFGYRVEEPTD